MDKMIYLVQREVCETELVTISVKLLID